MRPSCARFNSANGILANAILSGDYSLQSVIRTYCGNLRSIKLRCSAPLATICRSVSYFVCMICAGSIPSQISKHVILTVSVIVAAFLSFRFWADKGYQNKGMNSDHFWLIVFPQKNERPWVCRQNGRLFELACFYIANAAMVRNFIASIKSGERNSAPSFHSRKCGIFSAGLQA